MTLPKDALRVFIVLSSYADGRERLAWPSQDTIARDLGWISKSTGRPDRSRTSTAISALLEADLVRKAGRQRHGVRAWTTRYVVAPLPGEGLYEPSNTSARGVVRNRLRGCTKWLEELHRVVLRSTPYQTNNQTKDQKNRRRRKSTETKKRNQSL